LTALVVGQHSLADAVAQLPVRLVLRFIEKLVGCGLVWKVWVASLVTECGEAQTAEQGGGYVNQVPFGVVRVRDFSYGEALLRELSIAWKACGPARHKDLQSRRWVERDTRAEVGFDAR